MYDNSVSWRFSHLFVAQEENESSEYEENDGEFDKEILKYVGKKIGMKLTKAETVSNSLVLKKNDTELIQAAKVTMIMKK